LQELSQLAIVGRFSLEMESAFAKEPRTDIVFQPLLVGASILGAVPVGTGKRSRSVTESAID
jgi:hypothetical protein